mgnify:CR=1 FL=1
MTMDLSIYDMAFFEWHVPLRDKYRQVGDWLWNHLDFRSAMDLGCGNGFILEELQQHGAWVIPVEAVPAALKFMYPGLRKHAIIHDLTQPIQLENRVELIICTEVAEHLPQHAAETLLQSIFNHAQKWLFFSAATPGQGGHGHLNEQPHQYWIDRLKEYGFEYQEELSMGLRKRVDPSLSGFRDNSMIFKSIYR